AALEVRGCKVASVPLGGLKLPGGTSLSGANLSGVSKPQLDAAVTLIKQHLAPIKGFFGQRNIVLLDYTQSGQGLRLGQLLIERAILYKVTPVALQAGGLEVPPTVTKDFTAAGMQTMKLPGSVMEDRSLSALIGGSELKPFSDF